MIPTLSTLPAKPKSIVIHWTGGSYEPNAVDRRSYHYLVTGDGEIVAGVPVERNMKALQPGDDYAAHIGGANSFRVGVSFCGMAGAKPGGPYGDYPLKREQVLAGCWFIAELCTEWELDPSERTLDASNPVQVFDHASAGKAIGVPQPGKWDITELPFQHPGTPMKWIRDHIVSKWMFPPFLGKLAQPKTIFVPKHIKRFSDITPDDIRAQVASSGRSPEEVVVAFLERVADFGSRVVVPIARIVSLIRSVR